MTNGADAIPAPAAEESELLDEPTSKKMLDHNQDADDPERQSYHETAKLKDLRGFLTDEQGLQYDIPTIQQAEETAEEQHGPLSLQAQALGVLNRGSVQLAMAGLLLLDVIVLFVELALLTMYPPCHTIERDAISCCPYDDKTGGGDDHHMRLLAGGTDICNADEGLVPKYEYDAGCDDHKWHQIHRLEEFLFGVTMFILATFFTELLVTVWALGPRVFFCQAFYVMDLTIVTASLALELTFHYMDSDNLASMAGLLILGRVWRFVRIGHGIVEVTAYSSREKYEQLIEYAETLEKVLIEHHIPIPEGNPIPEAEGSPEAATRRMRAKRHHHQQQQQQDQQALPQQQQAEVKDTVASHNLEDGSSKHNTASEHSEGSKSGGSC